MTFTCSAETFTLIKKISRSIKSCLKKNGSCIDGNFVKIPSPKNELWRLNGDWWLANKWAKTPPVSSKSSLTRHFCGHYILRLSMIVAEEMGFVQ